MAKFDSGIGSGELPEELAGVAVAVGVPGEEFLIERRLIGDASIEALLGNEAQFNLRDVEPTAVAWRVGDVESSGESVRFVGTECLVERSDVVRVEIVTDKMDFSSVGEVLLEQPLDLLRPVEAGAVLAGADSSPAQQRRKEHEEGAGAVTLVLVILASRLAGRHRQSRGDPSVQFLARLVHADQWLVAIERLSVEVEHLFHLRHEAGGVALGNAEALLAPWLKEVFLSVLRIVSRQMLVTILRPTVSL